MHSFEQTQCAMSTFKKTLTAGLFYLILVCFTSAGAAPPQQSKPDLKIAVNVTTIESFPLFAAVDAMSANTAGPRVELISAPNGRFAMTQLLSGAADAATGSETQALLNSVADPRLRIVLTLSECRYRIIVRKSAGIRRVSDLRGKAVAVTANTSSQYYLSQMMRKAGLKESDVRLVVLEGQEMPTALEKRTVDAVSIWEPHAQHSLKILGADAGVLEDPSAYTERFNLNTRTDVLSDPAKRRALMALMQEIARASNRIRTRPAEVIPSLAPKVGLPAETVTAVWPQFKFPAALSNGLRGLMSEVEPWAAALQKRPPQSPHDLDALIDSSLAAEALR